MAPRFRFLVPLLILGVCASARAEVLIRWDQEQVPSPQSLGIGTLVVPATNRALLQSALAQGYRLYLEVEGSMLTGFTPPVDGLAGVIVKGKTSDQQLQQLRQQLKSRGARVIAVEERGKWPHIRTNWVTRNKEVLQVTNRSSQPWIENNAALIRILARTDSPPLLTYVWKPITLSDIDEGPRLEHYLVAIAEAGSFGADLLLPLHSRFQRSLILARPDARADWNEIRRHVEFYSWSLAGRYQPLANIGVVTADPMVSFEVMNLLLRHNLPFVRIDPAELPARDLAGVDLLIVLDRPQAPLLQRTAEFARKGGAVLFANADGAPPSSAADAPWRAAGPPAATEGRATYAFGQGRVIEMKGISNPDSFALDMRQILGAERRVIDIWNGITVLTASYVEPGGTGIVVTALNYTAQPLPVQLRVRGTFSQVQYESPEEPPTLLPYQHRNGCTEFVLPGLRIGGRVFLSRVP